MEPITEIKIECQGALSLPLDSLNDLQGNLKELSEANYVKLRNSIVQYGFSFPALVWTDSEGKHWVIDAHQRIRTLKKMREEGITIPDLPVDIVNAKDKTEAKKKLLLLNSRYGKMTREGYDEFIDEPDFKIEESDMEDLLVLPEVEMWNAPASTEPGEDGIPVSAHQRGTGVTNTKTATCPECNNTFEI